MHHAGLLMRFRMIRDYDTFVLFIRQAALLQKIAGRDVTGIVEPHFSAEDLPHSAGFASAESVNSERIIFRFEGAAPSFYTLKRNDFRRVESRKNIGSRFFMLSLITAQGRTECIFFTGAPRNRSKENSHEQNMDSFMDM